MDFRNFPKLQFNSCFRNNWTFGNIFAKIENITYEYQQVIFIWDKTLSCFLSHHIAKGNMELPPYYPPKAEHPLQNFNLSQKTILNLLNKHCTNSLQNLEQAHALILKTGYIQQHYVAGSLLNCYANPHFGTLSTLLQVLEHVSEPNVFVWNSAIRGCLRLQGPSKAISLYSKMVVSGARPNKYTYPQVLKACTLELALEEGLQVHGHVIKHGLNEDEHVISAGIQMYASVGCFDEARTLFESNGVTDTICCNAMIDGYMRFGDVEAAVELFEMMKEKSVSSWNTMITGFFGNEMIFEANEYFSKMVVKDDVSWSAMIDGYNKSGHFKEALEVFIRMQREEFAKPSKFLLSSALASCANVGALDQGKWIHAYIRRNRIALDAILGTSLVDMYVKCGRLESAWDVFTSVESKEVSCWNAMIGGFAMHGKAEDAIDLFLRMNVKPNGITYVAVLNACAHAGLVHEGLKYFVSMKEDHKVDPTVEHYGCVVNLLGKAGYFTEAEDLIRSMPMKPNGAIWGALLCGCRSHGNVELGEKIGEILVDLEPENSGRYALLSNMYARAGEWERAEEVRVVMKGRGVKTTAGRSAIDLNCVVHEFKAGDTCHPQIEDIYLMLEEMEDNLRTNVCALLQY